MKKMEKKGVRKYTVAVIGKELFPQRMHIERLFGETLYDQLISILEIIGEELQGGSQLADIRLGVYLDTNNPKTRVFSLSKKHLEVIADNFGHAFHKSIAKYAKRQQKLGTDILLQLNNGNICMNDFQEEIKKEL